MCWEEIAPAHEYFYACDAHCMNCGELTNPDAKHTIIHVDEVKATCQATGNIEYWACSDCGACWSDEALTQVTNRFNVVTFGGHNYVDGKCEYCGEADPDYVALFKLAGSTMTLGNTLEINFVINNADIQGEGNYVVITKQYADERGLVSKTIEQSAWERFNDTRKYVSFTVSAKEMNDPLTATVYNAEGKQISEVYHDSVAGYCVRMLGKEEEKASPVMKKMTLFVDMVNYGAAAQLEWGYNVENLANAGLTEQQKAYATTVEEDLSRNILDKGTGYAGTTLSLKENILLNVVFQNATINKAAYAIVSYTGYKGRAEDEVSYRVEAEQFQALGNSMKYVQINTLKVADYAQAVTVTLYDADGNEVSKCVESIESYLMRNYNKTILNPATLAFCEGAYEYLK